jgi:HPt (histidine-containing phosphotransfer) domain-containing protein
MRFEQMRRALSEVDMPGLERAAHSGISTASAAGFVRLQETLSMLEDAARREDVQACSRLVPEAEAYGALAIAETRDLLAAGEADLA